MIWKLTALINSRYIWMVRHTTTLKWLPIVQFVRLIQTQRTACCGYSKKTSTVQLRICRNTHCQLPSQTGHNSYARFARTQSLCVIALGQILPVLGSTWQAWYFQYYIFAHARIEISILALRQNDWASCDLD
jgi:hypothetical protein